LEFSIDLRKGKLMKGTRSSEEQIIEVPKEAEAAAGDEDSVEAGRGQPADLPLKACELTGQPDQPLTRNPTLGADQVGLFPYQQ
jgi:hypothetical protein